MAERRYIRLKETEPNVDAMRTRPEGFLSSTDGTVGEGPWRVRTDQNGFIITGNVVPAGIQPLVILGDSFVEATFTPEPVRFTSQLERRLAATGSPYRVLNGGYSGATALQLLNVFLNKIVPLVGRGGTTVFFIPQTDISIYFRPHSYWYPTDRFAPVLPPFEPESEDVPRGSGATVSLLRLAVLAAEEFGIRLIVATSPHRHAVREEDAYLTRMLTPAQFSSVETRRADVRNAVLQFVEQSGIDFIDADGAFMSRPEAFYDELHMNDTGHDAFAEWFAEAFAQLPPVNKARTEVACPHRSRPSFRQLVGQFARMRSLPK